VLLIRGYCQAARYMTKDGHRIFIAINLVYPCFEQGGLGNGKIDLGLKIFLRPLGLDLPTLIIRHTSIYGSVIYVASGM